MTVPHFGHFQFLRVLWRNLRRSQHRSQKLLCYAEWAVSRQCSQSSNIHCRSSSDSVYPNRKHYLPSGRIAPSYRRGRYIYCRLRHGRWCQRYRNALAPKECTDCLYSSAATRISLSSRSPCAKSPPGLSAPMFHRSRRKASHSRLRGRRIVLLQELLFSFS